MSDRMQPIDDISQIPPNLSDEEQIAFLEARGLSEELLESTEQVRDEERPRSRSKPINVRFDDFTLKRLARLADQRNVGYQTLLKQFVTERLYEEEKREGALFTEQGQESRGPSKSAPKVRDWLNEVHEYIKEHKDLLEDPELDSVTNSSLANDSASMLKELSGEINKASKTKGFPAKKLRRMMKAYEALEPFPVRAIELYKERFGMEDEEDEDIVKQAERILQESHTE